jgi:hypothetical protein
LQRQSKIKTEQLRDSNNKKIQYDYKGILSSEYGISRDFMRKYKSTDLAKIVKSLIKNGIKSSNKIINYFLNNPVDFKEIYVSTISEMLCSLFQIYNINDTVLLFKKNIIKSPLIINCPKINLLKDVICKRYNSYHDIHKSLNIILFCYILNKIGFNFNIYDELSPNDITRPPIGRYNRYSTLKDVIIDIVRFGKYIGQDIPEHLRDRIYKFCENSQLLDTPLTDNYIKEMIKKIK